MDIPPDMRPRNKAQALFFGTMRDIAGLGRQMFDITLLTTGILMSVNGSPQGQPATVVQPASIAIGS